MSNAPGSPDAITWPSSYDDIAKLKALGGHGDDDGQQSEESAEAVLKAAGVI